MHCAGYGEEEEWIDLTTVQGYRRMVMCQEVRDEVQRQLACCHPANHAKQESSAEQTDGEQHLELWQQLLLAMCDRRLLPTHWLNKVSDLCKMQATRST